jgi:hypothetical protein
MEVTFTRAITGPRRGDHQFPILPLPTSWVLTGMGVIILPSNFLPHGYPVFPELIV